MHREQTALHFTSFLILLALAVSCIALRCIELHCTALHCSLSAFSLSPQTYDIFALETSAGCVCIYLHPSLWFRVVYVGGLLLTHRPLPHLSCLVGGRLLVSCSGCFACRSCFSLALVAVVVACSTFFLAQHGRAVSCVLVYTTVLYTPHTRRTGLDFTSPVLTPMTSCVAPRLADTARAASASLSSWSCVFRRKGHTTYTSR